MIYNGDSTKYCAWGDTMGKNKNGTGSDSFSQADYKAGACGSGHTLTGDIPQGNATYDAARANMGSPWKMPTGAQIQELIDCTKSTYITLNGVNGRKFAYYANSSKYIFLPAGGYWDQTYLRDGKYQGRYWSTQWHDFTFESSLVFDNTSLDKSITDRTSGYSIRGVR